MNLWLPLPLIVLFLTASVALLAWNRRTVQRAVSVIGAASLLVSALMLLADVRRNGIQSAQMGAWPAPFGITLVADLFAAIMVVMTGIIGLAIALYSLTSMDRRRESFGYYPLIHVLLMGVCGSFLTGDIFNLYVWFEVMLISSFVLMELGGEKAQLEGAIKYVALNLMSSALFLTAVGILYGVSGTLNMADLALQLRGVESAGLLTTVAVLFMLAFGIKAGAFPLFFWLPASYHTPPVSVSALFAGLLTKVGVYALIRVFTLLFIHDTARTHTLILIAAGLTMLTGVLGAVAQDEFRRLLSFHIVSQIGYMLMGLGLFTPLALAGSIFHIIHNMLAKTNLFLVGGVLYRLKGTYQLKKLGGLYRSSPGLTTLFLISAFALAGMPPLSGFWSKLILVKAGLDMGSFAIVGTALLVSILTTYSMTKIWNEVFWKATPATDGQEPNAAVSDEPPASRLLLFVPIIALASLIVVVGLAAQPFLNLIQEAADQLMNPDQYIRGVLGGGPR
jgi:multicomponent Na+:H+ antiporter subunit D